MWWRRLAEGQTEHQNREERGFKWLWTWNGCWCQTAPVWVFKKQRMVRKRENIQWAAVVWTKMLGCSSRRPHQVPLLSAKNRKLRLQFAQAHQNWIIEDWKNVAWSDESQFLLRYSDGRVRIWRKEHESMDPSCLVSTVQAGGGGEMVRRVFSWHTLSPLVPIEYSLNTTAYLSIVAHYVHPFMTTVYPSTDG